MKKIIAIVAAVIVLFAVSYIFVPGFIKTPSGYISDYTVSEDGTQISINVSASSSVGYIRKVSVHSREGGKLYLDLYNAFGGFNGSLGAKDEFTIELDEDTEMIALFRDRNLYEEVLAKNSEGDWVRIKK